MDNNYIYIYLERERDMFRFAQGVRGKTDEKAKADSMSFF